MIPRAEPITSSRQFTQVMRVDLHFDLNVRLDQFLGSRRMLLGLDVNASLRFPAHHGFTRS